MVRNLIALVLAFAISISGIVKPAYADSSNLSYVPANSTVVVNTQGDSNSVIIRGSFNGESYGTRQETSDSFVDGLINGAKTTLGVALGGAAVCYTIDGVATLFFPPAGALSAFCPAMGSAFGSGNAVNQGVKAVINAM